MCVTNRGVDDGINNNPASIWDLDKTKQQREAMQQRILHNHNNSSRQNNKQMDTIGSLIDKLITTNFKIAKCEDIKRDAQASDKIIADATRLTNQLNQHRNQLIREIDEKYGVENFNNLKTYGRTS